MTGLAQTAVVAIAAAIAGFTGFGFNLVAVPLLAVVMPVKEAIVVALVVGIVVQLALAGTSIRKASIRRLAVLGAGAALGVVIGAAVFSGASTTALSLGVALLTLAFGLYLLVPINKWPPRSGIPTHIAVGGFSGLLAAATGMSGPPVVAYIVRSEEDVAVARATIAGFAALAASLALVGLLWFGSIPQSSATEALQHVPAGLIGVAVGSVAFHRLPRTHRVVSAVLLIMIGCVSLLGEMLGT